MKIFTARFGQVDIDDQRLINFKRGLLGFSSFKKFALLQPDEAGVFFWLQSVDSPELAFVVTDPVSWVPEYRASLKLEQTSELNLESVGDAQVLVIVNKYEEQLTVNLQGPLVIHRDNREAAQIVLSDSKWGTRHQIVSIESNKANASINKKTVSG